MIEKIIIIMMMADDAPIAISLRPKVNFCRTGRHPGGRAGAAVGHGDDEVVGLDGEVRGTTKADRKTRRIGGMMMRR